MCYHQFDSKDIRNFSLKNMEVIDWILISFAMRPFTTSIECAGKHSSRFEP